MRKSLFISFFLFVVVFALFASLAHAKTSAPQVRITLLNQDPDPVNPGDTVVVRLKVENIGGESLDHIMVKLAPHYPLSLYDRAATKDLSSLDAYQTDNDAFIVKYTLKVADDAVAGDAFFTLSYSTDGGTTWITLQDFSLSIKETTALLALKEVTTNPEAIAPGEEFTITLTLKSLADQPLRAISATFPLDQGTTIYPFTPVGSANEQIIEQLLPRQQQTLTFKFVADTDATINTHKLPLTITYYDQDNTKYEKSYLIGIKVYQTPQYSFALTDTNLYKHDQRGTITTSIANTAAATLKFVQIKLLPNDHYYTILSSDTSYIGNLESDDFDTAEFTVHTEKNNAKEIPFHFLITYHDAYGKEYEKEETLRLPLYSEEEAIALGYASAKSTASKYVLIILLVLSIVFWLFMAVDLALNPLPWYKKLLWALLLIGSFVIGAFLYYVMARRKE